MLKTNFEKFLQNETLYKNSLNKLKDDLKQSNVKDLSVNELILLLKMGNQDLTGNEINTLGMGNTCYTRENLEKKGYITKDSYSHDKRKVLLKTTVKAKNLFNLFGVEI